MAKATRDLTERRQTAERRKESGARLKVCMTNNPPLVEDLDALAQMIARDLRPPLRNIETLASQVREGIAELNTMAKRLELIAQAAASLTKLTNDLLMFSRTDRPHQANLRSADLNAIVADIREDLGAVARRIRWSVERLPMVTGDAALLRVVFEHLLSNAVKFTRQRDPAVVQVKASAEVSNEVLIEIKDNGVGFDEQHAHKLFGAFQRLHEDSQFEGAGIGLATVKRIVECHGGRIWARSRPGKGASFCLTLLPAAQFVASKNKEDDRSGP